MANKKIFEGGKAQHKDAAPLSEEAKNALRDILCDGVCIFADHCDGWRYASYCMLMDSGAYPDYLKD